MASTPGGFAEYAVTDWGRVHRIPANNMTYEQATCFPVALQTMHNAVVTAGRFKPGETLLIQGASSGVGLMGMQMPAGLVITASVGLWAAGKLGAAVPLPVCRPAAIERCLRDTAWEPLWTRRIA
jgi:NADPH:quinone reductase-like Zn-dependent oxidoreductase